MRYGFFDENGRIAEAHNDDTITDLPVGADELSTEEWERRFDLRKVDGVLVTDPLAQSLSGLCQQMWSRIKLFRDRRSEAGCLVAGYWFHNDLKSRTQWERMANRATTLDDADPYLVDGEQVAWKTMSGAFVPLTVGLIRQVVDAFEVQEVAIFKAAETHRAQMEAAPDPAAYDYSGNWPAIYQDL